jgi:hypothetical protein
MVRTGLPLHSLRQDDDRVDAGTSVSLSSL